MDKSQQDSGTIAALMIRLREQLLTRFTALYTEIVEKALDNEKAGQ